MPLRVIYDRYRYQIPVNPTTGLRFFEAGNKPKCIVGPDTVTRMLDAWPPSTGRSGQPTSTPASRKGELQALRVEDVQPFPEGRWGLIEVRENMDRYEGVVSTKSSAGKRKVPVPEQLYAILEEHLLSLGRNEGLVFGKTASQPFNYGTLRERSAVAWRKAGIVPRSTSPTTTPRSTRPKRRRSRTYRAVGCTTAPVLKTGWATGPMPLPGRDPSLRRWRARRLPGPVQVTLSDAPPA